MQLLRNDSRGLVLLFGAGLIGEQIGAALCRRFAFASESKPLHWTDPAAQQRDLQDLAESLRPALDAGPPLSVIWSAGAAGFGATEDQCAAELGSFARVLDWVGALPRHHRLPHCRFLLVSSAGGLFEGQRAVNRHSVPCPLRPYGRLKARQEGCLRDALPGWQRGVYRPSSVYGPIGSSKRLGLISTMVLNGLRGDPTTIIGDMSTLRDYVWAEDLGSFLAEETCAAPDRWQDREVTLASLKPSTVYEIQRAIERVMHCRLKLRFSLLKSNAANMSFDRSCAPPGWRSSDWIVNLHCLHRQALQHGVSRGLFSPARSWCRQR